MKFCPCDAPNMTIEEQILTFAGKHSVLMVKVPIAKFIYLRMEIGARKFDKNVRTIARQPSTNNRSLFDPMEFQETVSALYDLGPISVWCFDPTYEVLK